MPTLGTLIRVKSSLHVLLEGNQEMSKKKHEQESHDSGVSAVGDIRAKVRKIKTAVYERELARLQIEWW
jgi:hypothetical protein